VCDRKDIRRFGSTPYRLTTGCGRGATAACCFALATLTRPTLRSAALQDQVQVLAIRRRFANWILRYDAAIVFDLDIQICTPNDAISESQDLRKAVRSKPVIGVIADVRLQHDLFLFSGYSAAIDEVPDHISNFSDVGVCRDVISIRQDESRKRARIFLKRFLQIA
jgi:hypothetical protein